jgi:hypothetical protein
LSVVIFQPDFFCINVAHVPPPFDICFGKKRLPALTWPVPCGTEKQRFVYLFPLCPAVVLKKCEILKRQEQ